jgi:outer membrane protein OmpA-like peptidoglycan-associated protein
MKLAILFSVLSVFVHISSVSLAQTKSEAIVLFDIDKYDLKISQKQVIDSLLNGINNKNYKICLTGRADSSGNISDNLILSENRVKTVADYLSTQGFDSERITYDYFGENRPLLNSDNSVDLQLNRSVHMRVLYSRN